jgi:predicted TIM-barrel fold metal-dependent hydrolase
MRDGYFLYDAHIHMGTARHSGRRQTAGDLLREMDRYGVDRSLAIPFPVVDDFRAQHDEIGAAVRAHPDRFRGAASLNPYIAEAEFRGEVKRCREEYGFAVLKVQPQYQAVHPLWPRNAYVFEAAVENAMALIWHTGSGIPYSLPSLLMPAARQFPELKIVLAHCGGWLLAPEAAVAASFCPNIYLEVSTLMPNQIHEVLGMAPAERLMLGSDLPENLDTEMGKILGMRIAEEQKRAILGATARAVFDGGI